MLECQYEFNVCSFLEKLYSKRKFIIYLINVFILSHGVMNFTSVESTTPYHIRE